MLARRCKGRPAATLAALALMPCTYEVLDSFQAHQRWTPARWPLALLAVATLLGLVADWQRDPKDC